MDSKDYRVDSIDGKKEKGRWENNTGGGRTVRDRIKWNMLQ